MNLEAIKIIILACTLQPSGGNYTPRDIIIEQTICRRSLINCYRHRAATEGVVDGLTNCLVKK